MTVPADETSAALALFDGSSEFDPADISPRIVAIHSPYHRGNGFIATSCEESGGGVWFSDDLLNRT